MSIGSAIGPSIGRAIGSAMAGGGAEPAFDPATLFSGSKNGVWIKPRDWTTLFQNSGGTGAVTAATDPVGYATDQSGNAKHMINPAAGQRPFAITVGSVNAIDFDGSDDFLVTGAFTAGTWTGMDFFIAVYLDAFSASGVLFGQGSNQFFGVAQNGAGTATVISAGSPSYKINGVAVPGGTSTTRNQLYAAISTGGWFVLEANSLDLSSWIHLIVGGYPAYEINGKVAELIICESVSDAVRAQVRTYLGAAVGLTI